MALKRITEQQAAFLKFEIDTRDARRQKAALQQLSRLYRGGAVLAPEARYDFEVKAGYLATNSPDEKVVRWSLNALARFGTLQGASNSVEDALRRNVGKPEIQAAAIAALAALYKGRLPDLPQGTDVPPEMRTLAAMQTVNAAQLGAAQLQIDIDTADPELLKLALIVVGLNKDIQHLLHPRHENGAIVRALAQHDDPIVRQYCIWAVIENRRLELEHLGIPFDTADREPENVQAKLLELGATSIPDLTERHDLIIRGSSFQSVSAREGLAKGLVNTFYDGVETVTLDWFRTEAEHRVAVLLAEHFGRFADRRPSYEDMALELADRGGDFRRHVLLGADGKPLERQLRENQAATGDLFGRVGDGMEGFIGMLRSTRATSVLVLSAMPDDAGRIRPDKEAAELRERIAGMKEPPRPLAFEYVWSTRLDQIQQELIRHKPSILHFSGHGAPGVLVFEDPQRQAECLEGAMLARILKGYRQLECLVLHACLAEDVALACLPHVPFVVGSTDEVDDITAPRFSYVFYQGIAGGMGYEQAFEMGQTEVAMADQSAADAYKLFVRR